MIDNKNDKFITEISEEDFLKLNLKGYQQVWEERINENGLCSRVLVWNEVDLNQLLRENIEYWINQGYESDYIDLQYPVTVAIHKGNEPMPTDFYLDKFMNRFTGATTYQIGMGIKHLYSTRDYFEAKEDYWRVAKKETKAIYRIHLHPYHLKCFKLKHKKVISKVFDDETPQNQHYVEDHYDLVEATDIEPEHWELTGRTEVRKTEYGSTYSPYKEDDLRDNEPKIG